MDNRRADENCFVDILKERRENSDIIWASRDWNAKVANSVKKLTPDKIKLLVLQSNRLKKILKKVNQKQVPLKDSTKLVLDILNEIGYNREVPILRWLGFLAAKIFKRILLAVYVNEPKILQIKFQMGSNPLLFLPSHKSYCDFILMSYICFHYEIDIPRIAAGMDFQAMALLGNVLRDACAFFMRRSFVDDELYTAVFSQYVHTLIVEGDGAIEFFIEGTRSRTQKSLMPKYGFLSMALKPFLMACVPDITVVPVNLSYDRVLEEVLFAYELLGVPKPKESTKGFIKALSILNKNYGNIYVKFGEPISVKRYFSNKVDRSVHGIGSLEMQDITPSESKCIISLAHSIVRKQKELTSLNCFNLIATVVNDYLLQKPGSPNFDYLILEVQWLLSVLKTVAPQIVSNLSTITKEDLLHHLDLHKSLLHLSGKKEVHLCRIHSANALIDLNKLKGCNLSDNTMDIAIPTLMLQYYVNPCAAFLIHICFIAIILESLTEKKCILADELLKEFEFLQSVFSYEFVLQSDFVHEDFTEAFNQTKYLKILEQTNENELQKGENQKLHLFCLNFLNPYFPGYIMVIEVLMESVGEILYDKQILKECQRRLELKLRNGSSVHPANLSLDLLSNALQALVSMKAVSKKKGKSGFEYEGHQEVLENISLKIRQFYFSSENTATVNQQFSFFVKASL